MSDARPLIIGLGGTLAPNSSTERAVRYVLKCAEEQGAAVRMFNGMELAFPLYVPGELPSDNAARHLLDAVRNATAIIIGSPAYHGGISGLMKNALDYLEELSKDAMPYLSGRAIACIATGAGWQGANSTLHALRSIVHSLRGWPTPLGLALNSRTALFDAEGSCIDPAVEAQLRTMASEVTSFGSRR